MGAAEPRRSVGAQEGLNLRSCTILDPSDRSGLMFHQLDPVHEVNPVVIDNTD